MNTSPDNYHISFMPGLRLETADEYGVVIHDVATPEPVAPDQSELFATLQAQIDQIEQVDNTERGRRAVAGLQATLSQWSIDYQINKL